MLQAPRAAHLEPVLCDERSHCDEKPSTATEWPLLTTAAESLRSHEDPEQPKVTKLFLKKEKSLFWSCVVTLKKFSGWERTTYLKIVSGGQPVS